MRIGIHICCELGFNVYLGGSHGCHWYESFLTSAGFTEFLWGGMLQVCGYSMWEASG